MRPILACFLAVFVAATLCAADAPQPASAETELPAILTFAELLAKAERIVVAEAGAAPDGGATLAVRETLKAPETEAARADPERLKRAAMLLENSNLELPPLPPPPKAPAALRVQGEAGKLPKQGTQAIFFLWERAPGDAKDAPVYRIAHPQCVYDLEVLAQVKNGVAHPRTIADGRYLRSWDREMAGRMKLRQANAALLNAIRGEESLGLRIRALRPSLSLRGDNSFAVTVRVENTRPRDQAIYDGLGGGYGVILRQKNAEAGTAFVVRKTNTNLGADASVLNIADPMDFAKVPGNSFLAKELFFDAAELPRLRSFEGEYMVSAFFTTAQDGKGLGLDMPVWTGTLVSEEVPLIFKTANSGK